MIGTPLWVDALIGAWGHQEFAHVCVCLDLAQKIQTGVWINGMSGRFYQRVEYEGLEREIPRNAPKRMGEIGNGSLNGEGADKHPNLEVNNRGKNAANPSVEEMGKGGLDVPNTLKQPANSTCAITGGGSSKGKQVDVDDDERQFGPWNLIDLKKVPEPTLVMKQEKFKPTWREKQLGIKQALLFGVGVKPPRTRDRLSQDHWEKELQ
ncbi:hypothetical protein M5K25_026460 [Dendrobium thyrsiflorum]|uniref:Uncharacterized protein n=1 Tax=Dendrobium thyrsiflorum TaxID=117978 RepID=A0ABD0TXI5_DENTH